MFTNAEIGMLRLELIDTWRNFPGITVLLWQVPFTESLGKWKAARNVKVSLKTGDFLYYASPTVYIGLLYPELHC